MSSRLGRANSSGEGLGYPTIWYRGQADESWAPLPGALRKPFIDAVNSEDSLIPESLRPVTREKTINKQFQRMGASYLPVRPSLVDVYLIAQHHGLPTRLLDWSTNPLSALFFAVSGHPEKDGAILVANPRFFIPNASEKEFPADVVNIRHRLITSAVDYLFGEGEKPKNPIVLPVVPEQIPGRIFQQGSCFTLHMPDAPDHPNKTLEKFVIPKDAKPTLLRHLRRLNITSATIYADLDNVAKEIRSAWRI
jgi:hypothetical protein